MGVSVFFSNPSRPTFHTLPSFSPKTDLAISKPAGRPGGKSPTQIEMETEIQASRSLGVGSFGPDQNLGRHRFFFSFWQEQPALW
jgi:hypothetical protein